MSDVPSGCWEIVCQRCGTKPRLKSLKKNAGTGVECDCDGPKHHMDSVPYELADYDLPDAWEVQDG